MAFENPYGLTPEQIQALMAQQQAMAAQAAPPAWGEQPMAAPPMGQNPSPAFINQTLDREAGLPPQGGAPVAPMPQAQPEPQIQPQAPIQAPQAPAMPQQFAAMQPTYDSQPMPQAQQQPQQPQQPQRSGWGIFGGDNGSNDFGRRLERAAAWIAPPGNAQAALGFRNSDDAQDQRKLDNQQRGIDNARADKELELKKQTIAMNAMKFSAPDVKVETSDNGKFRTITKTNPLTGEVTFSRQAIPEDEQKVEEKKYLKPSASTDKMITEDENSVVRNVDLMREGLQLRDAFRNGQIDVGLIGKTDAELQTLMNSNDPKAANAMLMKRYLQGIVNQTLRGEKGVQTDSDAKRIATEIMGGSAQYNNSQMYKFLGDYMGKLKTDTTVRTGRSQNVIKRYGPDYDPESYRQGAFGAYRESADNYYDSDNKAHSTKPYTGASVAPAPAGGVTSPILRGLRERFGVPGAR